MLQLIKRVEKPKSKMKNGAGESSNEKEKNSRQNLCRVRVCQFEIGFRLGNYWKCISYGKCMKI